MPRRAAWCPIRLAKQILDSIGARAVAMKMGSARRLLAVADMPPPIDHDFDMRNVDAVAPIVDAFETLLNSTTRTSCASSARRRWAASSSRS